MESSPDITTPDGFTPEEWKIARTLSSPVLFAKHWLGLDLWGVQQSIADSVATRKRTKVKACHASGKTLVAAAITLWFMTRYPDGFVINTAPSWTQVEKHMWGEIHRLIRQSCVRFPEPRKTELVHSEQNYALGLSTNEGVRFQGFHGAHGLIIKDESPGIRAEIHEAIQGVAAGGDIRELDLGNPVIASGPFYDSFSTKRQDFGDGLFTISAFDTPNLQGLTLHDLLSMPADERLVAPWPMLTTRQWVYERFYEWGGMVSRDSGGRILEIVEPTHPGWQSRVLGEFPDQAEDALFSTSAIEAARKREPVDSGGDLRAGIDVAGPGEDETVLVVADPATGAVLKIKAWSEADPRKACLKELKPYKDRLEVVNVDTVGMGYYFGLHLSDDGYQVKHINVGRPARNKNRYFLRKDEYYWGLRMRAQDGELSGLVDDILISQLLAHTYSEDTRGKVRVDDKDEVRKRIQGSPDRAEALMLAFANASRGSMSSVGPGKETPEDEDDEPTSDYEKQFRASPIGAEFHDSKADVAATCGQCAQFKPSPGSDQVGKCESRMMTTNRAAPECPYFERKE